MIRSARSAGEGELEKSIGSDSERSPRREEGSPRRGETLSGLERGSGSGLGLGIHIHVY